MNNLTDILTNLLVDGSLAEIFSSPSDSSKFAVSQVLAIGSDCILVRSYDVDSSFDCYILMRLSDIVRVGVGTTYLRRFDTSVTPSPGLKIDPAAVTSFNDAMEEMQRVGLAATFVDYCLEQVPGILECVTDDEIVLKAIHEDGRADGRVWLLSSTIRRVEFK